MEPYPIVSREGFLMGFICSSTEFTEISWVSGLTRLYMWLSPHSGVDVTSLVENGILRRGGVEVQVDKWLEKMPITYGYTINDLDSYVDWLSSIIKSSVEGKKVILSYSGGKDSTSALIVLLKLMERISFKLHVAYIHMPYLESPENIKFIDQVSRRLNIEIEVVEPPRRIVLKRLMRDGLPYRRARWCTYLKVRMIRELEKRYDTDFEVYGDRVVEAGKRLKRLAKLASKRAFVIGGKFRPTFTLTLLDVVKLCRSHGIVHPDYLRGLPRVSCSYCPYKSLHEFSAISQVEDPGLIDEILKREYEKWYKDKIEFDDFINEALWRYAPAIARMFHRARSDLKGLVLNSIDSSDVHEMLSSLWINSLPRAPTLSLDDVARIACEALKSKTSIETT